MINRHTGFRAVLRTIAERGFLPSLTLVIAAAAFALASGQDRGTSPALWPISMDYPEAGSIFPPGITPPTFIWRDGVASSWSIEIRFADHSPAIHSLSKGERMHLGEIDPECIAETNEPPAFDPATSRILGVETRRCDMENDSGPLHSGPRNPGRHRI